MALPAEVKAELDHGWTLGLGLKVGMGLLQAPYAIALKMGGHSSHVWHQHMCNHKAAVRAQAEACMLQSSALAKAPLFPLSVEYHTFTPPTHTCVGRGGLPVSRTPRSCLWRRCHPAAGRAAGGGCTQGARCPRCAGRDHRSLCCCGRADGRVGRAVAGVAAPGRAGECACAASAGEGRGWGEAWVRLYACSGRVLYAGEGRGWGEAWVQLCACSGRVLYVEGGVLPLGCLSLGLGSGLLGTIIVAPLCLSTTAADS